MRIKNSIIQYGFINSLKRFVKLILRKLGVKYESYLYMINISDSDVIKQKMFNYTFEDVKELDYDDFKNTFPQVFNKTKLDLIKSRFDSNNFKCYGIIINNVLAYYFWISTKKINFPSNWKKSQLLNKDEGFLEDAFCHPLHRKKGYHSKMTLYNLSQLHKLNKLKNIVLVLSENKPAYKANLKSDFITEKKIIFISFFGKNYYIEKYL